MKVLILGHYSYDVIHQDDGTERRVDGGLQRAMARLACLLSRQDHLVPVFGVHASEYERTLEMLRALPGVDVSGVYPVEAATHRVDYYPSGGGMQVACVKEMSPPIPFDRIRRFLDADGVLINMESGMDLTLETLDEIRMGIRGSGAKIHLDFHNLTQGIGPEHRRIRRPLNQWRRWAFMMETVQMNHEEIAGLTPEGLQEKETAGHLLTLSVKGVIVTRGPLGASLYYDEHKKVVRKDFLPPPGAHANHAGEGDLFGALFFSRYCKGGDLIASMEFAAAGGGE
jgi:hypothetical protein